MKEDEEKRRIETSDRLGRRYVGGVEQRGLSTFLSDTRGCINRCLYIQVQGEGVCMCICTYLSIYIYL
ncbi:hypothetical protein CSUI_011307 [Cystoisospora suis]|uniref:Uncharacterized protein n=1 Tax=Cystoisospora suis TaxID=483139 RepID=A0A2C6KET9_9APIC|nr:hypothetical protein CSUI_011307 [Cystoisospora suis]